MAAAKKKASKGKKKAVASQDSTGGVTSRSLNPFKVGGSYWAAVEGLRSLGIGKMHPFAEIVPAVKRVMGEQWKAFAEKDARNEKTGKDASQRTLQNIGVLTRPSYSKPLRERGYEIRWSGREKVAGLFKLGK